MLQIRDNNFRTQIAALAITLFVAFSCLIVVDSSANDSQVRCSKSCIALNCYTVGIKYGKYCGVGYTGCPGEKPCDELDVCCEVHDDCVGKYGMTNVKCHEKFKRCVKKVQKSGKAGFSRGCPYSIAAPTMVQGMDMAILMSQWVNILKIKL